MSMKYGPKKENSPSIGKPCPACKKNFKEGDYTTLISYGPGDDPEQQQKCAEGRPYNAVAAEVHYDCVFGKFKQHSISSAETIEE